jgi:hypothetical protein
LIALPLFPDPARQGDYAKVPSCKHEDGTFAVLRMALLPKQRQETRKNSTEQIGKPLILTHDGTSTRTRMPL